MQDKHAITLSDGELVNHRVHAGPFLKVATGPKAEYHSDPITPPKIPEDRQSMCSPQMNAPHLDGNFLYPSNPAVYGTNNAAPVLLTDPYANVSRKSAPPTYTESMSHYAQPPSDYGGLVMPSDIWFPGNDTAMFDGQLLSVEQYAAYNGIQMGAPAIPLSLAPSPPRGSPHPSSFLLSSGTSSGNSGNGSPGSFSPHSRSSTVSPISPQNNSESAYIHPTMCQSNHSGGYY